MSTSIPVGIDAFGFYIPKYFLKIETLATKRNIPAEKLTKGLGLKKMAVCEAHETTDFMAAKAIIDLVSQSKDSSPIDFQQVDKIFLGTESSVDSAKPTITYALNHLNKHLNDDLTHVDFLDMTFACIGGIDALLLCVDYVRLNPTRKCIVVVSDNAIYDLGTGGEYTQGAGAMAMLISSNPSFLTIDSSTVGVSTSNDFDFYKPLRNFSKEQIFEEAAQILDCPNEVISKKINTLINSKATFKNGSLEGVIDSFWDLPENIIHVHRKQPVYDGKYSNECYEERISQALNRFTVKFGKPISNFSSWIFHLPYAYQGRRTSAKIWWEYIAQHHPETIKLVNSEINEDFFSPEWWKALSKTTPYKHFVSSHIESSETLSSELGNLYTGSIFMATVSTLISEGFNPNLPLLFLSYGSGSKSKVFAGQPLQNFPKNKLKQQILSKVESRTEIDFETYEEWHQMQ